jgi:hypothetical protein
VPECGARCWDLRVVISRRLGRQRVCHIVYSLRCQYDRQYIFAKTLVRAQTSCLHLPTLIEFVGFTSQPTNSILVQRELNRSIIWRQSHSRPCAHLQLQCHGIWLQDMLLDRKEYLEFLLGCRHCMGPTVWKMGASPRLKLPRPRVYLLEELAEVLTELFRSREVFSPSDHR